jgi:hypothetical protein
MIQVVPGISNLSKIIILKVPFCPISGKVYTPRVGSEGVHIIEGIRNLSFALILGLQKSMKKEKTSSGP